MSSFPRLETERLILRCFDLPDANAVQKLLDDPEVVGNLMGNMLPYSLADAEAMIVRGRSAFKAGGAYMFAVVRKSNDDLVGYCNLELQPNHHQAEIAYWIGRPYWWQGYATEAAKAVLAYGFETLGLQRIYAYVLKRNQAALRVLEKAGLSLEDSQSLTIHKDGIPEDVEVYSLLRDGYGSDTSI